MLKKKEILPAVAFTFSKKKIEEVSGNLNTVDLTTASEKSEIHVFFQKCISRLKGTDKELPQVCFIYLGLVSYFFLVGCVSCGICSGSGFKATCHNPTPSYWRLGLKCNNFQFGRNT
uniref:Uncharacterized protein n=1 Tax=Biomphalaria glabrata TaxID=6526 RepID=A0A2C9LVA6_BIOGL